MTTPRALQALLTRVIDYAGVFPPASLGMRSSVANYAAYRAGAQAWMLGRFVVPVARLGEFGEAAAATLPGGASAEPWRLCAVAGAAPAHDLAEVEAFNRRHDGHAMSGRTAIELFEVKVGSADEVRALGESVPRGVRMVCEVPVGGACTAMLQAIHDIDAIAKIRTGGLTVDAIPSPEAVAEFLLACRVARVPFKATAGLHHPVRSEQRLTSDPGAPRARMHGFVNVFLAAALVEASAGGAHATGLAHVVRLLDEDDAAAFSFSDEGARWRDIGISEAAITSSRARAGLSFGSCSFDEPLAELRDLGHAV